MALSFRFTSGDAQVIASALNDTEKLKGISFNIGYEIPGIDDLNAFVLKGDFKKMIASLVLKK